MSYLLYIKNNWSEFLSIRENRYATVFNILFFILALGGHIHYLKIFENRHGFVIFDPIHNLIPSVDLSGPIFLLTWGAVLLVLQFVIPRPLILFQGLMSFSIMFIARTITIYYVPLEAPQHLIPLIDPVASIFLHGDSTFVKKDLFFSGHTAALVLLIFIVEDKRIKNLLTICAVIVPAMIVIQQVHYTIDVVAAPVAAFLSFKLAGFIATSVLIRTDNNTESRGVA